MQISLIEEARRQADICNACRYCEGYCSVFPSLHRQRSLADGDLIHLANLCHNCRGCYYACQYTEPHEFALNLPNALAEVRRDSWESFAWPGNFARLFQRSGMWVGAATVVGFALLFMAMSLLKNAAGGAGFYAELSHNVMVAIFLPAFLFPLLSIAFSLRNYWKSTTDGGTIKWADVRDAFGSAAKMKNLAGGHGEGCNFEDEDRYSHARRLAHHAVMYGFLLCFASTSVATIMHYGFDLKAPYPLLSLPKLLGLPGGVLLTGGAIWMLVLKYSADRELGAKQAWGGEIAFVTLLGFVAASGLALFAATGTSLMPTILALHLGAVLSFFLLTPYSKMAHGFYRLTALIAEARIQRLQREKQASTL